MRPSIALGLGLAFLCSAAASAGSRGPIEGRIAACKASTEKGKHRCFVKPQLDGKVNIFYGWNVGKGHPSDDRDPPSHDKLLNGLDQCGWYHDRGAGRWNPRTRVCENAFMCANTIFLYRCMSSYQPANADEVAAKKIAMERVAVVGKGCMPKLYRDYGVQWQRDEHGSSWLSSKAEKELAESFSHCKPGMATPGWPPTALQAFWSSLKLHWK